MTTAIVRSTGGIVPAHQGAIVPTSAPAVTGEIVPETGGDLATTGDYAISRGIPMPNEMAVAVCMQMLCPQPLQPRETYRKPFAVPDAPPDYMTAYRAQFKRESANERRERVIVFWLILAFVVFANAAMAVACVVAR